MKNKVMKIITIAMSIIILVTCIMLLAACRTDDELKSRNEELQNTINNLLATQSDLITRNEILQNTVDGLLAPENELGVRYANLQNTLSTLLAIDWSNTLNIGYLYVEIKSEFKDQGYGKEDFKGINVSEVTYISSPAYLIYLEESTIDNLIKAEEKILNLNFVKSVKIEGLDVFQLKVSIKPNFMNESYVEDDFKGINARSIDKLTNGSYLFSLEKTKFEEIITVILKLYALDFVDDVEIIPLLMGL